MFLFRFFEISLKVTAAGTFGTYFMGWNRPFPISWVWGLLSSIGGFIASCFGIGILKIGIVSFVWPLVIWLTFGIILGLCIAGYESQSKSNLTKSEV
jgi:hypothetical protein